MSENDDIPESEPEALQQALQQAPLQTTKTQATTKSPTPTIAPTVKPTPAPVPIKMKSPTPKQKTTELIEVKILDFTIVLPLHPSSTINTVTQAALKEYQSFFHVKTRTRPKKILYTKDQRGNAHKRRMDNRKENRP
jgi:hypothetical protein